MIALDASLLIAYLSPDDPHHSASMDVLARPDRFVAHTITLAEALVRGARDDRLDAVSVAHAALGIEELPRAEDEPRRLATLRVSTGLKLPDCCVLLAAEATGASVATFDARLARAAGALGIDVV